MRVKLQQLLLYGNIEQCKSNQSHHRVSILLSFLYIPIRLFFFSFVLFPAIFLNSFILVCILKLNTISYWSIAVQLSVCNNKSSYFRYLSQCRCGWGHMTVVTCRDINKPWKNITTISAEIIISIETKFNIPGLLSELYVYITYLPLSTAILNGVTTLALLPVPNWPFWLAPHENTFPVSDNANEWA